MVQPIIFKFSDETSKSQETIVPGASPDRRSHAPVSTPAPPPPAAFGRYAVQKAIGKRGAGRGLLGARHATRPAGGDQGLPRRQRTGRGSRTLAAEARRLARLRHPGIVTVHDVGTQDGQVFIVSDYLDGQDPARWLRAAFADLATERGHSSPRWPMRMLTHTPNSPFIAT